MSVAARSGDGRLTLDVTDEGPGIALEERDRIFEPFYQGGGQADGLVKGTGIGLSVVKEYVAAHGGSVKALGRDGGPGALLRVVLPSDATGETA
ncbi:MAG: ATP-binding protein [Burkholderiales bacterium]|nr:ATP-binding protein [Burkholderiales bacterium]